MKWFLSLMLCAAAWGENTIQGPTVGWVWDGDNSALRPILGIPGSSLLGAPLDAGFSLAAAVTSNSGDLALLLNGDDGSVFRMSLRDGSGPRALAVSAGVTRLALSPRGTAAALYYEQARKIVVVRNVTGEPEVAAELDLTTEGMPDAVAVPDDASGLVGLYRTANAVMAFRADGNRWKVDGMDGLQTAVYFDNSGDVLVAGPRGTGVIADALGDARVQWVRENNALAAAPAVVRAPSATRGTALVLEDGGLIALDLDKGTAQAVECSCQPSTVVRMSNSVFRINELSSGPLWLAEFTAEQPRTIFVPADTKTE